MAGNFTEINHIKKRHFLNAFAELGGIRRAEERSKVTRQSHYHWLKEDPEYAAAFKEAERMAGDMLEDEAVRRAHDGVEKPVYQQGMCVGHIQEYSDTLLIFLLKGAKPAKYKDGGADFLKLLDLSKLSDAQLERLANGDDPIKALLG